MRKYVALFSGQGSQYPGMGRDLCEKSAKAARVYECAGDILGFDVAKASFDGTEEDLARTIISQPVIFTLSLAAFSAAKDILPEPSAVAGHSLGEFAALCCAGAYSLEDGFRLIKARASAMDEASSNTSGAMYAIIGAGKEEIEAVCREAEGFVAPANYNLPNQTVISGEEEPAAKAAAILAGKGARTVRLAVSSAFHTRLMEPAAKRFRADAAMTGYKRPHTAFYSNLTGKKHEISDYPEYFAEHMVSPVRLTDEMSALASDGIEACVEFGPGRAASAIAKKNVRGMAACNVEDMAGVESLTRFFGIK